jgi:hypothetical protein
MQMVFIEGVPGSGKSCMAERLCSNAASLGIDARWYLEESPDHPLRMKAANTSKSQGRFAEECLASWARFVDQCKGKKTVHIVEGIAFQSTVRFMMEMQENGIAQYYRRFEEVVACLNPKMVYLRPRDVAHHSREICAMRGEDWSHKVSSYLAHTRYSTCHELTGISGMHQFWTDYAALCDDLLVGTRIPTKTIDCVSGEWDMPMAEASRFIGLDGISNEASATPRLESSVS